MGFEVQVTFFAHACFRATLLRRLSEINVNGRPHPEYRGTMTRHLARYGILIFFLSSFIVITYFQSVHHRRAIQAASAPSSTELTAANEAAAISPFSGHEIRQEKTPALSSNGGQSSFDAPAERPRSSSAEVPSAEVPASQDVIPQLLSPDPQSWNVGAAVKQGGTHGSGGDQVVEEGGLRPLRDVVGDSWENPPHQTVAVEGLRPLAEFEGAAEGHNKESASELPIEKEDEGTLARVRSDDGGAFIPAVSLLISWYYTARLL